MWLCTGVSVTLLFCGKSSRCWQVAPLRSLSGVRGVTTEPPSLRDHTEFWRAVPEAEMLQWRAEDEHQEPPRASRTRESREGTPISGVAGSNPANSNQLIREFIFGYGCRPEGRG